MVPADPPMASASALGEFRRRFREELDSGLKRGAERPRDGRVRPRPLWGSFPLSEVAIGVGIFVGAVGFAGGGGPALLAGIAICVVSVLEVAVREHASGYRSHAMLVALITVAAFQGLMYAATGGNWVGVVAGASGLAVFGAVTFLMRLWFGRVTNAPGRAAIS